MSEIKPVTVHIMGNEYHVSSPAEEVEKLEQAARNLDHRMREIKSGGRIVGVERIAVMAALNMAHELIEFDGKDSQVSEKVANRINKLKEDIDSVLASNAQMELT